MDFNNTKPIYLQLADRLMDDIVSGVFKDEERIPAVREFAVQYGVNTNTAMKTYDELSRAEVIYNKRGLGYFVTPGAKEQIRSERRKLFMEQDLPQLARQLKLIGITPEQLLEELRRSLTPDPSPKDEGRV